MFAHNTEFDFKMLDGFKQLSKRNWQLKSHYVKAKTFILTFRKKYLDGKFLTLHIWDTMNYVVKPLADIGITVGFPKLNIDFSKCNLQELEIYCMRDTEILYEFIKKLTNFLETNDLTKLRATAGSISFNTFRHKFYKPEKENTKIYIHDWKRAIKLERESYKGGITDNFKVGKYKKLFKLDINSMYPSIMEKSELPTKLVFCSHESNHNQKELFKIYKIAKKNGYGCIMKVSIELPYINPYILNNFGTGKSLFSYGKFKTSLCTPELEFVEKYGKIIYIHEINIYKMCVIFKEFVGFFYDVKVKAQKDNNLIDEKISKLILNTQYGKWGQRDIQYKQLFIDSKFMIEYQEVIKLMLIKAKRNNPSLDLSIDICYLGSIIKEGEMYLIDGKLYLLKQTTNNSKESFVAIASFITSYSRMLLIKYLKIAKRKNVCYCDTDSLFVNKEGYNNLKFNNCINSCEIGKLKLEAKGKGNFYAPKFYDFNDIRKVKGINQKTSIILSETKEKVIYEINQWQKFKTDLKLGYKSEQVIHTTPKQINKLYDKGKVDYLGNVIPFSVKEIEVMIQ